MAFKKDKTMFSLFLNIVLMFVSACSTVGKAQNEGRWITQDSTGQQSIINETNSSPFPEKVYDLTPETKVASDSYLLNIDKRKLLTESCSVTTAKDLRNNFTLANAQPAFSEIPKFKDFFFAHSPDKFPLTEFVAPEVVDSAEQIVAADDLDQMPWSEIKDVSGYHNGKYFVFFEQNINGRNFQIKHTVHITKYGNPVSHVEYDIRLGSQDESFQSMKIHGSFICKDLSNRGA